MQKISNLFTDGTLDEAALSVLNDFEAIVSSSHPLTSKQRLSLPRDIRMLSHNLTDERAERRQGYMNNPAVLSAYIRYFSWWNLVRLTKVFSSLPATFFCIQAGGGVCLDIGSGPLTVPIALLLARPELRNVPLTWYCMDLSATALSFGEDIFLSAAARLAAKPWNIVRVKGALGSSIRQKVSLVTGANVFNEISELYSQIDEEAAKKYCSLVLSYMKEKGDASVLLVEPGERRSAHLISLLRSALIAKNFMPIAPCTHSKKCCMNGLKGGKWCNFAFAADCAPRNLQKLSAQAQLSKERAVLSFVASSRHIDCNANKKNAPQTLSVRITSDAIRLPLGKTAYYACSECGLLLVLSKKPLKSGDKLTVKPPVANTPIDKKSRAPIVEAVFS